MDLQVHLLRDTFTFFGNLKHIYFDKFQRCTIWQHNNNTIIINPFKCERCTVGTPLMMSTIAITTAILRIHN